MEQQKQLSAKQLKQRKFLTVLPLLVLPFLTFLFWFAGGGKAGETNAAAVSGFNTELPGASVRDYPGDKLLYYEQAAKDSADLRKQRDADPYYNRLDEHGPQENHGTDGPPGDNLYAPAYAGRSPETEVMQKLERLNEALHAPEPDTVIEANATYSLTEDESLSTSPDIARLEQMMASMQQEGDGEDPEMQQINAMLETVLDIQHPERVQQRLRETSEQNKGQVFPVESFTQHDVVTSLATDGRSSPAFAVSTAADNGFFSLDDPVEAGSGQTAIEAVIHEQQTLVSGSTVKLRLLSDVFINGKRIPKDNFVYGNATLNGERLEIAIDHIRHGASVFAVSLSVHDMDGMRGVYIPGAITRDVMKQSSDQSLQSMGMMTMNPSLGVQAASAGIELGKNLLSRKIRLVKVQVKAGYKVLLLDKNQRNN